MSLEDELPHGKSKKKKSLLTKIIEIAHPNPTIIQKAPIGFNIVLSAGLFILYFFALIAIGQAQPYIFFFILPLMYLLARHIKLERELTPDSVKKKKVFED